MADRKTSQLFPKYFNTIAKVSVVAAGLLVVGGLFAVDQVWRGPYMTEVKLIKSQPVPFPHEHHVKGLGIDCRYCHKYAEKGAFAGVPPTSTCMNCHSQIWSDSPMLEPVREAYEKKEPIKWVRIHDLPEFAYFNHSIHLAKGMGCTTCHGPVHEMRLAWKENSLYMGWCLECHRNPEKFVRPKDKVYEWEWPPTKRNIDFLDEMMGGHHGEGHGKGGEDHHGMTPIHPSGEELLEINNINKRTESCSVCHR